ncbi:MAG TPA: DUF1570 domain-containing protein [Pirellulales bacterium]|jgi:hypothetical protein|nr:DUF1570 domain-containing protein [Pirellulales bacterium]
MSTKLDALMPFPRCALLGWWIVVLAGAGSLWAQAGLDLAGLSKLPMEELRLKSDSKSDRPRGAGTFAADKGRVLRGLIVAESSDSVDFMEFRRPPGRPMNLVMYWRYPQERIEQIVRLPEADRQQLAQRIDDFKNRRQFENETLPAFDLHRVEHGNAVAWHYENPALFPAEPGAASKLIVDSTADEETTRRSILRIEEIFSAYREILPPRRARPAAPLSIKLFGAIQEYQAYLGEFGLRVENPAVYVPSRNLLVAGSELSAYAEQLDAVRKHHKELRKESESLAAKMPEYLVQFRKELASGGFTKDDQIKLVHAAEARFKRQQDDLDLQIHAAERRNIEEFDRVTELMFARLFHEAFHAYLENYVYPQSDHDVPRWLNEGLAQVFESGQLESGSLRLDAPDSARLKSLQQDLRSPQALSLAELLSADEGRFLVLHPGGGKASQRYYLYSWGLAFYLAFRQPLLETPSLDRFVERSAANRQPIERFEQLVGMPLGEFEAKWRAEMLTMKSAGR